MINAEILNESLYISDLNALAREQLRDNRLLAKFAVATLVIDDSGQVLVCEHEARDGESDQGALGSVTETLRYVPSRGAGVTETPLEAFQRCLIEEHAMEDYRFEKAGFYFDRMQPAFAGEWVVGPKDGVDVVYPTINLLVRVANPDVLVTDSRPSKEIIATRFEPFESVFASIEPKRPGYQEWLRMMQRFLSLPLPKTVQTPIVWQDLPETPGIDVRYPYTKAAWSQ